MKPEMNTFIWKRHCGREFVKDDKICTMVSSMGAQMRLWYSHSQVCGTLPKEGICTRKLLQPKISGLWQSPSKMFLFTCLPHKSSSKHPSAKMIVWLKLYEEKRLGKVFYLKMTSDNKKYCFIALEEETRGAGRSSWKRSPGLLRMLTLTRMPVRLPPSHVMNANMSQRLTRGWRSTKAKHTSLSRTCEDHQKTTL